MYIRIEKSTAKIILISVLSAAGFLFLANQLAGSIPQTQDINLWAIFLTGLLTGGLTCLAVQGGLLASTIAQRHEQNLQKKTVQTGNALPILIFLVAKLIVYSVLGLLLGWFGSLFQLSLTAQIIMQAAVVIFMLGTALSILNVHSVFRYFVIQPPKFLYRIIRKESKSGSIFAPAILGAFTVFIPCGTTQAMMALAIGSGSPILGAAVLFAFVLGTSPIFFTLGYFATKLGQTMHKRFMKVAAFSLIILALFNLNNILALTGFTWNTNITTQNENAQNLGNDELQDNITIAINDRGYTPQAINVKAGTNVTLTLKNQDTYTCASAFTIPYFKYQDIINAGESKKISLKMPDKATTISFMCSMGMYRGVINVI